MSEGDELMSSFSEWISAVMPFPTAPTLHPALSLNGIKLVCICVSSSEGLWEPRCAVTNGTYAANATMTVRGTIIIKINCSIKVPRSYVL